MLPIYLFQAQFCCLPYGCCTLSVFGESPENQAQNADMQHFSLERQHRCSKNHWIFRKTTKSSIHRLYATLTDHKNSMFPICNYVLDMRNARWRWTNSRVAESKGTILSGTNGTFAREWNIPTPWGERGGRMNQQATGLRQPNISDPLMFSVCCTCTSLKRNDVKKQET